MDGFLAGEYMEMPTFAGQKTVNVAGDPLLKIIKNWINYIYIRSLI